MKGAPGIQKYLEAVYNENLWVRLIQYYNSVSNKRGSGWTQWSLIECVFWIPVQASLVKNCELSGPRSIPARRDSSVWECMVAQLTYKLCSTDLLHHQLKLKEGIAFEILRNLFSWVSWMVKDSLWNPTPEHWHKSFLYISVKRGYCIWTNRIKLKFSVCSVNVPTCSSLIASKVQGQTLMKLVAAHLSSIFFPGNCIWLVVEWGNILVFSCATMKVRLLAKPQQHVTLLLQSPLL